MIEIQYLAVANFVIGVLYYLIILAITAAPFTLPWLRRLGRCGVAAAVFLSLFFFGCGSHHLDVSTYFWTATSPISGPHANLHTLMLWETFQIVGAMGFIGMLVAKGSFFARQLQDPLRDVQNGR